MQRLWSFSQKTSACLLWHFYLLGSGQNGSPAPQACLPTGVSFLSSFFPWLSLITFSFQHFCLIIPCSILPQTEQNPAAADRRLYCLWSMLALGSSLARESNSLELLRRILSAFVSFSVFTQTRRESSRLRASLWIIWGCIPPTTTSSPLPKSGNMEPSSSLPNYLLFSASSSPSPAVPCLG
jgi:hypothetical protein